MGNGKRTNYLARLRSSIKAVGLICPNGECENFPILRDVMFPQLDLALKIICADDPDIEEWRLASELFETYTEIQNRYLEERRKEAE